MDFKRADRVMVVKGAYAGSYWIVAGVVATLTNDEPRLICGLESLPGLLHILSPGQVKEATCYVPSSPSDGLS
jgi:hypothetical protein